MFFPFQDFVVFVGRGFYLSIFWLVWIAAICEFGTISWITSYFDLEECRMGLP